MRIFPRVFKGEHTTDPRVSIQRAKHIRIEAENMVAYGDGERIGPLPIDVEVVPGRSGCWRRCPDRSRCSEPCPRPVYSYGCRDGPIV